MRYAGKQLTESEREELFGETSSRMYESLINDDMDLEEMARMETKEMSRMEMIDFLGYDYSDELVSRLEDSDLMEMVVETMMDSVWNDSELMYDMYDSTMTYNDMMEEDEIEDEIGKDAVYDLHDEEFEEMYDEFLEYMGYDEHSYIEELDEEM